MSKVRAEMPSNAQQSEVGTDSTNPAGAGTATGRGATGREIPAAGMVEGAMLPSRTVAFIGFSGMTAMRAVSLRGPVGVGPLDFSMVDGGMFSFVVAGRAGAVGVTEAAGGAGGFKTAGGNGAAFGGRTAPGGVGVAGRAAGAGGGGGGFKPAGGNGAAFGGRMAPGGIGAAGCTPETGATGGRNGGAGGGRTGGAADFTSAVVGGGALGGWTKLLGGAGVGGRTDGGATGFVPEGIGAGGRAIGGAGGRTAGAPPAGGNGLGATGEGGGRTGGEEAAGRGDGPPGERFGKLMRTVSFCDSAACGLDTARGGKVMRTVSFFGSFKSAMKMILESHPGNCEKTSAQTRAAVSISNRIRRADRSRARRGFFA